MRALSKEELKRKDAIIEALREASFKIEEAMSKVEDAVNEANSVIAVYNETVNDANAFREDIANSIMEYMDEKSDKWRESDTGQQYDNWHRMWDEELSEAEMLQDVDGPETDAIDQLEQMVATPDEA